MSGLRLSLDPKRTVVLLLVLALCALPAFFQNGWFGYFPLLFLLCLCLLSLVWGAFVARGLRVEKIAADSRCRRGEDLSLRLFVRNTSRLVCPGCTAELYTTDLFGKVRSRDFLRFTLAPGESREFSMAVRFDHTGRYRFGLRTLRTQCLLGAASYTAEQGFGDEVCVEPRLHALERLSFDCQARSESRRAQIASSAESVDCSGVREYAFGDPIKLIHWKLSSHAGDYVTKLLESYGNNALTVVPSSAAPDFDGETLMGLYDTVTECCASLCVRARELGMDVELLCRGRDGGEVRQLLDAASDFSFLIDALPAAGPEAGPGPALPELLAREEASRYSNSNIAVCAAQLSEETAQALLRLRRAGKSPLLFYARPRQATGDDLSGDRILRSLESFGVSCCVIPSADEIEKAVGV